MNGFDLIMGIFKMLSYFDKKVEMQRKYGYGLKIASFLGLLLIGAFAVLFSYCAAACFRHFNNPDVAIIIWGFFGVICVILAVYLVFYFFFAAISNIVIISVLIGCQRKYEKNKAEDWKTQRKLEDAEAGVVEAEATVAVEEKPVAKDQYQQESKETLKPKGRKQRIPFRQRLQQTSDMPYLKTSIGFEIAMIVLNGVALAGFAFGFFMAIAML